MHSQIEPGYLAMVEVRNRSELTERFEQIIDRLQQVNKQESQFKQWHGVHMSRLSGVRGDQIFDHPIY